jgi:hypothetical protein
LRGDDPLPPKLEKNGVDDSNKKATIHKTTMLVRKGVSRIRLTDNNVTTKQNTTLS